MQALSEELIALVESRPLPGENLWEPGFSIEPSVEIADWAKKNFILDGSLLTNPKHAHLRSADLQVMLTNVPWVDGDLPVVGMAELVRVGGKPWAQAERIEHLCLLHGKIPHMRVWLYAPFLATADPWAYCAVIEHELFHFYQKLDRERQPKFDADGVPVWATRAHDVEEFIGVVERYGVDACRGRSREFVEAALRPPLIAPASFVAGCATCGGRI